MSNAKKFDEEFDEEFDDAWLHEANKSFVEATRATLDVDAILIVTRIASVTRRGTDPGLQPTSLPPTIPRGHDEIANVSQSAFSLVAGPQTPPKKRLISLRLPRLRSTTSASPGKSSRKAAGVMVDHSQRAASSPEQSLRYSWFERIVDWRDGGRDARKGLPDGEAGEVTTPAVQERVGLFQKQAAAEYSLMTRDTKRPRARMVELNRYIEDGQLTLKQAEQRAAAMPAQLSEEELTQRHAGEQDTHELTVRYRRRVNHANECRSLTEKCEAIQRQLDQHRAEYDRLRQEIADCEQQMVNEWARHYAHHRGRIAAYRKRLYRVHPDGQYLQARLPELGQPELEAALLKLLDLTQLRHLDQSGTPHSQLASPGQTGPHSHPPIDWPPKEHLG